METKQKHLEEAINLNQINIDQIGRIYSGRVGCMCGCKGNYREGGSIQRVLKNMVRFIEDNKLEIETCKGIGDDGHIHYVESGDRCYAIYMKKGY